MNQKTIMVVVITAVVVLMLAPRIRSLPIVSKLPTV